MYACVHNRMGMHQFSCVSFWRACVESEFVKIASSCETSANAKAAIATDATFVIGIIIAASSSSSLSSLSASLSTDTNNDTSVEHLMANTKDAHGG